MSHKYRNYVDKENITFLGDSQNNLRYLLEIPLIKETKKSVLVIMKNPSKADENKSDHTINRVLRFCNSQEYGKVYIMNLYAYCSTNPNGIGDLIRSKQELIAIGRDNDTILRQTLQKVDDIIVAWGSNTFSCTAQYKNRIKQVTKIIKEKNLYSVESISKCGWYPKHAQVWSVNRNIGVSLWTPPFQ